jgi:hypothetical protein
MKPSEFFLNFIQEISIFKEIHRVRGTVPLGWNAKRISKTIFSKPLYQNLKRNHSIDQDETMIVFVHMKLYFFRVTMILLRSFNPLLVMIIFLQGTYGAYKVCSPLPTKFSTYLLLVMTNLLRINSCISQMYW